MAFEGEVEAIEGVSEVNSVVPQALLPIVGDLTFFACL